jgi:CRP/FNR family transcriptional regulator
MKRDAMTTATSLPSPVSMPVRISGLNGRAPWLAHAIDVAQPLQVDVAGLIDLLGGAGRWPIGDAETLRFSVHRVGAGAMLVHEGAHAELLHVVQSGSFKSVKTAEDGYEHVLGFAWRGDVLGFDGLHRRRYAFAAVALEDSRVVAVPLAGLDALRHRVGALDTALQALMSRQLTHAGEIAEVMSAVSADVRLARFLVQLSARMAERGQSPRRLRLGMNRRDIANHLGLAHETISRSFRILSDRGWLRVDNREIEILDLAGLKRSARSTRGLADEEMPTHQPLPCAA